MKEATGELNSTVIVVIAVGVLMAFFFGFIWPVIKQNYQSESHCSKATCDCSNENRITKNGVEYCKCKVKDNDLEIECIYKG